jgi:ATP-binding cassette, subfamily G (WHITE), eye pigment precursor transporter
MFLIQLLTDPLVLFCDEPTTGLDSYSATVVIEKLRALSERGMAIVCTIHQPTSGIFDLFHELILMASGRVAYQGEVAAANQYFSRYIP